MVKAEKSGSRKLILQAQASASKTHSMGVDVPSDKVDEVAVEHSLWPDTC